MAEGEGFVPVNPAHINDLRPFSIAQIARTTQKRSIRYKIGTGELPSVAAGQGVAQRSPEPSVDTQNRQLIDTSKPAIN
jgi:hypothetical protein